MRAIEILEIFAEAQHYGHYWDEAAPEHSMTSLYRIRGGMGEVEYALLDALTVHPEISEAATFLKIHKFSARRAAEFLEHKGLIKRKKVSSREHGTTMYRLGCRCEVCKEAQSLRNKRYKRGEPSVIAKRKGKPRWAAEITDKGWNKLMQ